eukprot:scaffold97851_cov20-Tisochrysis_lutea.AAC.3
MCASGLHPANQTTELKQSKRQNVSLPHIELHTSMNYHAHVPIHEVTQCSDKLEQGMVAPKFTVANSCIVVVCVPFRRTPCSHVFL